MVRKTDREKAEQAKKQLIEEEGYSKFSITLCPECNEPEFADDIDPNMFVDSDRSAFQFSPAKILKDQPDNPWDHICVGAEKVKTVDGEEKLRVVPHMHDYSIEVYQDWQAKIDDGIREIAELPRIRFTAMSDLEETTAEDRHRRNREHAEAEYEFYKKHGRPSGPFNVKCQRCADIWEIDGSLLDADHDVRYHAGYHGGWKKEHAEIVVTDDTGRELFRHHAIHRPEMEPDGCPSCGESVDGERIACGNCGHIPKEHLMGREKA